MKKLAVASLCGLFAGLWIGARVQLRILADSRAATEILPDAVMYKNSQTVPIPEFLETSDTAILKSFKDAFDGELNKNAIHDESQNYWVYRTGILHIRKPALIFQEAGEPAFYADSTNLFEDNLAKTLVVRLSEIKERMDKSPEADFPELKRSVIIPYAKNEANLFYKKNNK